MQIVAGLQPLGLRGQVDVLAGLRRDAFDLVQSEPEQVDLPVPLLGLGAQPVPFGLAERSSS